MAPQTQKVKPNSAYQLTKAPALVKTSQSVVSPPPPHLDICLDGEEQVSEEALMHVGPAELWDTEHGGPRGRNAAIFLLS